MSADVTKMLKKIEADKVKFIRLQFTDIQGMPKNVSIPAIQAEKALTEGIWFDGSSIEGFARIEESDMILKPDPATYAVLPWRPQEGKVARFICDVQTYGNKPFDGDPRYILRKTMAEAAKMGYTFNTGPELEFFLFKMYDGTPTTEFEDHGAYFDLAPTDSAEDVRRDVVLALSDMGFEIEASHHEVADSQHEIDFKYGDALTTADRVITFKFATKSIALQYGLHASFMAKPIGGINGSGMHTHGSLSKNGKNAFYDANAELQLSDTAMYYIGGILKHAKAITRVANPTINSYKRLVPGYEAPCYISWSAANRSALVRVPAARGNSTRASSAARTRCATRTSRLPACLQRVWTVSRTRSCHRNRQIPISIISMQKTARDFISRCCPASLAEANAALLKDEVICNTLGEHVVTNLSRIAEMETDAFRLAVHPWELDRYLATY